ncbi:hypothetical protein HPB51_003340 [Rhipicephalus microplus]|uniref:Uncharacterized protein n=1 Tax=Rhipicephalus microplus TaxID=6941 RepID=A0A9J6EXF4_RHIMP|nr:hypothetical protein HPB51_003340 [Rhipicephalus microplus]
MNGSNALLLAVPFTGADPPQRRILPKVKPPLTLHNLEESAKRECTSTQLSKAIPLCHGVTHKARETLSLTTSAWSSPDVLSYTDSQPRVVKGDRTRYTVQPASAVGKRSATMDVRNETPKATQVRRRKRRTLARNEGSTGRVEITNWPFRTSRACSASRYAAACTYRRSVSDDRAYYTRGGRPLEILDENHRASTRSSPAAAPNYETGPGVCDGVLANAAATGASTFARQRE